MLCVCGVCKNTLLDVGESALVDFAVHCELQLDLDLEMIEAAPEGRPEDSSICIYIYIYICVSLQP